MFTGHNGPPTMNGYWSMAIFTSDRTSGPVGSSLPAFMLLIKSQHLDEPLNLELMCYPLTPVHHSLGTTDGFFNNTNKAAMLHFLPEDAPEYVPYPTDALFIQDGNALFHAMTSLPPTFGGCHLSPRARPDDN